MALPLPTSLTPSKVASFRDCALAFRFSVIDRLPEPPSPWAAKGTLVHRALELLFWEESPSCRTVEAALEKLERAESEVLASAEFVDLELEGDARRAFLDDAERLVRRYFDLEDPTAVNPIGVELRLEAEVGGVTLRGIIDRLDVDSDGELVVTDYKTGRAPDVRHEQTRLGGVHFYAFLCEKVLGRRPARVQLLYLNDPLAIVAQPSDQSIRGLQQKTKAIWSAVERACVREDFRPRPSKLCDWCAFRDLCPSFGAEASPPTELVTIR